MSKLFSPLSIGELTLANRVIVAPMCQYAVDEANGSASPWHMAHLGQLAQSGAGLLILEATAVSPEGRITPYDLGLWSDENEAALGNVLNGISTFSEMPVAIQLGHAGRKASSHRPSDGGMQIPPDQPPGWHGLAPSAIAHMEGEVPPLALDQAGLDKIRDDFANAAKRAARIGIAAVEIHMAHGYLLHEFLSPLSNQRNDEYGGDIEGRMKFPLEVFDAVRAAFPADRPVWVRVSATDWAEGGLDVADIITLAKALKEKGCAAIHVSSGGVSTAQKIALKPGYQVHLAEAVKTEIDLPVIAVGLITEPEHAEEIIAKGEADAIALGRALLWNPRWPWHAASALGAEVHAPRQYWRSAPHGVTPPFTGFQNGMR